jgi:hypothetical protein
MPLDRKVWRQIRSARSAAAARCLRLRSEAGLEQVVHVSFGGCGGEEDRECSAEAGMDDRLENPNELKTLIEILEG